MLSIITQKLKRYLSKEEIDITGKIYLKLNNYQMYVINNIKPHYESIEEFMEIYELVVKINDILNTICNKEMVLSENEYITYLVNIEFWNKVKNKMYFELKSCIESDKINNGYVDLNTNVVYNEIINQYCNENQEEVKEENQQ